LASIDANHVLISSHSMLPWMPLTG
jgi:hypothetical protein